MHWNPKIKQRGLRAITFIQESIKKSPILLSQYGKKEGFNGIFFYAF